MNQNWINVATYSDRLSAEAVLVVLSGEGVPAYIRSDEHVPGLGSNFSVSVPSELERRARWLLQGEPVSENELTSLAMDASSDQPGK